MFDSIESADSCEAGWARAFDVHENTMKVRILVLHHSEREGQTSNMAAWVFELP